MGMYAEHNKTLIKVGDTIQVHYRILEKEKVSGKTKREVKEEVRERIQIFEGILIKIKGEKENKMFTVRKIGAGRIGIERIFPLASPWIKKISVKKTGKVRRAKLYYLRDIQGKDAEKLTEETDKRSKEIKTENKKKDIEAKKEGQGKTPEIKKETSK